MHAFINVIHEFIVIGLAILKITHDPYLLRSTGHEMCLIFSLNVSHLTLACILNLTCLQRHIQYLLRREHRILINQGVADRGPIRLQRRGFMERMILLSVTP